MNTPNYKKKYLEEVRPHIMKKFNLSSIMQVPKIEKITLNIGIGDAKNFLDRVVEVFLIVK